MVHAKRPRIVTDTHEAEHYATIGKHDSYPASGVPRQTLQSKGHRATAMECPPKLESLAMTTGAVGHDAGLAMRIEEASLNAWPAIQQTLLDGWILRFSKGFSKRSNSIVPLYTTREAPSANWQPSAAEYPRRDSLAPHNPASGEHTNGLLEKVRYCENLYAREALQTVFRLTSIPSVDSGFEPNQALEQLLCERGYTRHEPSLVLTRALDLELPASPMPPDLELRMLTLGDWLGVYCQLTNMAEPSRALHNIILQRISGECGFATLWRKHTPIACGLAVVERDLVGLFDIYTDKSWRNLGFGNQLVTALLDWGAQQGARRAYLQVLADNPSAAALYARHGFTEIYRYWYRIAP